jgi:hypothetical protein
MYCLIFLGDFLRYHQQNGNQVTSYWLYRKRLPDTSKDCRWYLGSIKNRLFQSYWHSVPPPKLIITTPGLDRRVQEAKLDVIKDNAKGMIAKKQNNGMQFIKFGCVANSI